MGPPGARAAEWPRTHRGRRRQWRRCRPRPGAIELLAARDGHVVDPTQLVDPGGADGFRGQYFLGQQVLGHRCLGHQTGDVGGGVPRGPQVALHRVQPTERLVGADIAVQFVKGRRRDLVVDLQHTEFVEIGLGRQLLRPGLGKSTAVDRRLEPVDVGHEGGGGKVDVRSEGDGGGLGCRAFGSTGRGPLHLGGRSRSGGATGVAGGGCRLSAPASQRSGQHHRQDDHQPCLGSTRRADRSRRGQAGSRGVERRGGIWWHGRVKG